MKKNSLRPKSTQKNPIKSNRRIVLITGGSRSGKSGYAQELAEKAPGPRVYVATCPPVDQEMSARIERHKEARQGKGWDTIEEATDLRGVFSGVGQYRVVVVDCLTLWINNLLWAEEQSKKTIDEDEISKQCKEFKEALSNFEGTIIFVTNEVGTGLVPADPLSRRFRDLVGRCNQEIAAFADEVVLMTAGIPMYLKKESR
jgi:adenosylcobinamide kinase/adenosylcobinamide-phosphate guanylyltransferase